MRIQKIAKESERFLAAEDQKSAYHFPPPPPPPPNPTPEKSKN